MEDKFEVEFARRPFPVRVDLVRVQLQWGHLCLYGTYYEGVKIIFFVESEIKIERRI